MTAMTMGQRARRYSLMAGEVESTAVRASIIALQHVKLADDCRRQAHELRRCLRTAELNAALCRIGAPHLAVAS